VLVADPEPEVRRRLAHDGGRLPVAAQRALSADPDAGVRRVLALQRGLAPEVARRLAGDGVAAVRRALTGYGWSLPGDTVRALLLDPDDEVRAGAVRAGSPPDPVRGCSPIRSPGWAPRSMPRCRRISSPR
jgi:hypothetical protein